MKCATVYVKNEVILMPVYKCQDLFSINVTKVIALICWGLIYFYLTGFEIYTGQIIWSIILDFLWPSYFFSFRTNSSLLPSQSVPTILVLKTWIGLWPWKKIRSKIWDAKSRVQKTLLFKKRKGQLPLLCLNNNDPAFCTPYFGPWFF